MKATIKVVSIFILIIFGFLLHPQLPEAAESAVQALEKIAEHNNHVKSIESRFTQTRYISFMNEELVSHGFFIFSQPDQLVWQYDAPVFFRLEYKNGQASFKNNPGDEAGSQKQNPRETEIAAKVGEQIMLWVSMDLHKIQSAYDLTITQADPLSIDLAPKNKSASIVIRKMTLQFADNRLDMRCIILHEKDGDYIKLEFYDSKRRN